MYDLNDQKSLIFLITKKFSALLFFLLICSIAGLADWVKLSSSRLNPRIIETMVMDTATKYIYAGTNAGAMFLSTDSCKNWREINNSWVFIDPLYNGYVSSFAVTNNYLFACSSNKGVWRSANNGNSWTEVNNGLNSVTVSKLTTSGGRVYAATSNGVYFSSDYGDTWTAINDGISDAGVSEIIFHGNRIYLGTSIGTYYSENNGMSWKSLNSQASVVGIAVSGTNIFISVWDKGVFLSPDDGKTWTEINNGISAEGKSFVTRLTIDGNKIFASTFNDALYVSVDNGSSWTKINDGIPSITRRDLCINGNYMFVGTGHGVYGSEDGGLTWTEKSRGLVYSIVFSMSKNDSVMYMGTNGGGYLSKDYGSTWIPANIPYSSKEISSCALYSSAIIAGTWGDGIFLSNDSGITWKGINNGLTNKSVTSIATQNGNIFSGTWGGGVFLSENNGESWTAVNDGISGDGLYVHAIKISGNNIFTGTHNGGIYRSSDNGRTWIPVNAGLSNKYVYSIEANEINLIAATGGGGIFLSKNNGANWTAGNTGMEDPYVNTLTTFKNFVFAGTTNRAVFLSTDYGTTWTNIGNKLYEIGLSRTVGCVMVNGDRVFAGTQLGLWRRPLAELIVLDISTDSLSIPATSGNSNSLGINSNTSWTISESETWISIDKSSGFKNETINLTTLPNNSTANRKAIISISGAGIVKKNLIVYQDGISTGMKDNESEKIKIFPNPVKNILFVEGITEAATVTITDMYGKTDIIKKMQGNQIDVSAYRSGIYTLSFKTTAELITIKFIKY